jgi:hypothetical protein
MSYDADNFEYKPAKESVSLKFHWVTKLTYAAPDIAHPE